MEISVLENDERSVVNFLLYTHCAENRGRRRSVNLFARFIVQFCFFFLITAVHVHDVRVLLVPLFSLGSADVNEVLCRNSAACHWCENIKNQCFQHDGYRVDSVYYYVAVSAQIANFYQKTKPSKTPVKP